MKINPMSFYGYGYTESKVELVPVSEQLIERQASIDQAQDERISLVTTGSIYGYPIEEN